ncbi:MAG: phage minor capsid protein [Oscillospiraceae bacterium]
MGLSPQYYDGCTDDVLNLYAELEDRIISDVVRRIVKTGDITETAKWQIRQAQQVGLLYNDIIKEVAKSTNKTDSEVRKMFEKAGVETVNNDNRLHIQAGKSPLDIRQSESMLQILNGVYNNSLTDLKNLTGTTAITSQTAYYQACNFAFMMVSSGAFSYQQALRTVIQEVGNNGATVSYPSGHVDKLDVAVRRSLLTGIGLASRQISEENSRLCGCDLMEISAHSGARPSHASWQGQIVSLSGRRGYLSKSDIGYGTGAGFGGWNCRHDWYPFYEGISTRNYTQSDLDKLNAKDIEYQGKMYSEYEISQILRGMERQSRTLKRQKVALKTAIDEGQTFLKSDLTAINTKIRDKSAQIQSFCNKTGYKRDRFRESINQKTSVGHTSKNYQNGLTFEKDSANIKSVANRIISSIQKPIKPTNRYEYDRETTRLMRQLSGLGLNVNFKSFNGFNKQLLFENAQRLNDLIERYPIAKDYIAKNKVGFDGIIDGTNTIGMCTRNMFNDRVQSIHLNKDHFISYYVRTKKQIEMSKNGEKMPLAKEHASVYTITHEFGHFIENILISNYNKEHLKEYNQVVSTARECPDRNKAKKIMNDWHTKQAYNIKLAILNYANKIDSNSSINYESYISQYGNKNPQEFFAECFANLHCGEPNILGLAIREYLKEVLKDDY